MNDLLNKHCVPYSSDESGKKGVLDEVQLKQLLKQASDWQFNPQQQSIERTYRFKNFHETMNFVRQIEEIIHREDHHPTMILNYATCKLEYSTHSVKGVTLNDFICAAKINAVFDRTGV